MDPDVGYLPTSGPPFYARLTTLLDGHHFGRDVEGLCDRFDAPVMTDELGTRASSCLMLVGYFVASLGTRDCGRATDSLAVRSFLRLPWTRRARSFDDCPHAALDLERAVFTWVQQRLVEAGRLKGGIDATTLEANAAMRRPPGHRRELPGVSGGSLDGLGDRTPTREGLADWIGSGRRRPRTKTYPHDPDATRR